MASQSSLRGLRVRWPTGEGAGWAESHQVGSLLEIAQKLTHPVHRVKRWTPLTLGFRKLPRLWREPVPVCCLYSFFSLMSFSSSKNPGLCLGLRSRMNMFNYFLAINCSYSGLARRTSWGPPTTAETPPSDLSPSSSLLPFSSSPLSLPLSFPSSLLIGKNTERHIYKRSPHKDGVMRRLGRYVHLLLLQKDRGSTPDITGSQMPVTQVPGDAMHTFLMSYGTRHIRGVHTYMQVTYMQIEYIKK